MRKVASAVLSAMLLGCAAGHAQAAPVSVVAAENMYGDIARQIGGHDVAVQSILNNPDEDPHLFEANVSVGKALADARIVVTNGAGYDPWMDGLLKASKAPSRSQIVVADLIGAKEGDNPHLWYRLEAAQKLAVALRDALILADPAHKSGYEQRSAAFLQSLKPIQAAIDSSRRMDAGMPVTATEPVFGYMAAALGFTMRNQAFQLAVMNNTEPTVSQTAAMESDLRNHMVKLFIYNRQATDTAAERLLKIAGTAHIPIVGVTETEPKDTPYQQWMLDQLRAVSKALGQP